MAPRVVVVGLGPAGPDLITAATAERLNVKPGELPGVLVLDADGRIIEEDENDHDTES